jgi:hypothetical protein
MDDDVTTADHVGSATIKGSGLCYNNGVRDWVKLTPLFNFDDSSPSTTRVSPPARFSLRQSTHLMRSRPPQPKAQPMLCRWDLPNRHTPNRLTPSRCRGTVTLRQHRWGIPDSPHIQGVVSRTPRLQWGTSSSQWGSKWLRGTLVCLR